MSVLLPLAAWVPILDGDPAAAAMYERHYSARRSLARRRASGAMLFIGPGEKLVLASPCRRALWAWRRCELRDDAQTGVECTIFRNEGAGLSSDLVRAADRIADQRWPGERHFTFVDEREVRGNPPGSCFMHAGWRPCGRTKERGLLILERSPVALRMAA